MSPSAGSEHVGAVVRAQGTGHAEGHDYDNGSPHLRHDSLRTMVETRLIALVEQSLARTGSCRVLEIGGGHGTFTRCLVEAGARVTVTEASAASAEHLRAQFGFEGLVEVRHDETGEMILDSDGVWDMAVMTAVLHHIPDYLSFVERLIEHIDERGTFFAVQDPLFYPRMPRSHHLADRAAYFAWRVFQGDYSRGVATRVRRLRGVYVDTAESDLVEYHVVREGVDEEAIASSLSRHFGDVDVFRYWSTQAPLLQKIGARTRVRSDFGVEATERLLRTTVS